MILQTFTVTSEHIRLCFLVVLFYTFQLLFPCGTIRYDTRCYFNMRSKADISQLNLPHGRGRVSGLMSAIECTLKQHIVSYRIGKICFFLETRRYLLQDIHYNQPFAFRYCGSITFIMPPSQGDILEQHDLSVCLSHGAAAQAIGLLAACSLATAGHQRCADCGPVRGRTQIRRDFCNRQTALGNKSVLKIIINDRLNFFFKLL